MAVSLTRFSWLYWGGKEKETVISNGSERGLGLGFRESDSVKFRVKGAKMAASRKVKRKWSSREERRVDKEYDIVLVPSDGVCLSGSEDEESDWSIGWLEPHAPGFQSDEEGNDGSFAVLVPCYRHNFEVNKGDTSGKLWSAVNNLPDEYFSESKYMEQWLSSLQNV